MKRALIVVAGIIVAGFVACTHAPARHNKVGISGLVGPIDIPYGVPPYPQPGVTRLAADNNGNLIQSNGGAAYAQLGSGGGCTGDGGCQSSAAVHITGGQVGVPDAGLVSLNGVDAAAFLSGETKIASLNGFTQYSIAPLASATTTMPFSGMNGDLDGDYKMFFFIVSNANTNTITLEPNSTTANQVATARDFTSGTGRTNLSQWQIGGSSGSLSMGTGDAISCAGWFWAKSGRQREIRLSCFYDAAGGSHNTFELSGEYFDKTTNLTSFQIVSGQTNGIGVGSYGYLTASQS